MNGRVSKKISRMASAIDPSSSRDYKKLLKRIYNNIPWNKRKGKLDQLMEAILEKIAIRELQLSSNPDDWTGHEIIHRA